ncbi:MAG: AAA family ATPase [Lachnospiraceae bacterium]|nr:AAA family ATPase [Lachnospiraceae bacterium]
MKFRIVSGLGTGYGKDIILFRRNSWDDYGFKTTFNASYCDKDSIEHELGTVKIAKTGMPSFSIHDCLKGEFDELSDDYYSLWQTAEAYKRVMEYEKEYHFSVLRALRDVAYDPNIYEKHKDESVLRDSLFRSVSQTLYMKQFRRIARGEAVLTPYNFSYVIKNDNPFVSDSFLDFSVEPDSLPPTNVHALIGSNGTGKTTLIKHMIKSICEGDSSKGKFSYSEMCEEGEGIFENIICISFSPFDDYSEIEHCGNNIKYIGIRKVYDNDGYEDGYGEMSLLDDTKNNYLKSLKNCLGDVTKKDDLKEVLSMLETECNFLSANYDYDLNVDDLTPENFYSAEKTFEQLSAGHKVVLSIITRCIDELVEKSVVFIDEPENHLHPPLLSSLIRGISKMLIKRNGVAIISTHSPIVLQEIPRSCVWILNRVEKTINVRRPEIETFGTNIGVLTNEIFGYEVQRTGFNTLIQNVVNKYSDYEDVLAKFNYQLGDEAKSIVRIMLKQKEQ